MYWKTIAFAIVEFRQIQCLRCCPAIVNTNSDSCPWIKLLAHFLTFCYLRSYLSGLLSPSTRTTPYQESCTRKEVLDFLPTSASQLSASGQRRVPTVKVS